MPCRKILIQLKPVLCRTMPGSLKFGRKVLFEMIRTAKNLLNIFKISFKKKLGKYFEKNPKH